jgi:predicted ATPase
LIRSAPEVKLVATSRQRLNLRGEWVLALDGLSFKAAPSAEFHPPAQALFLETARRVRGDDLIQQEPPDAIARICALVQGMPLAIELAAAWSRLLTCDELAEEIASNLTALEATTQEGEERHRSLRAVFDHSWQLFSPQEQRVLTALSAFASGFTRDAAQAVAGASLPMLLGLADKMLLRREAEGRFSLHEMIRKYLVEKLPQSAEVDEVRSAYLSYFTHFLQNRAARLKTTEQQSLLAEITRDIDNIHLAWETAIQFGDRPTLAGMLSTLSLFHDLKSNWRVALALLESAESALDPADTDLYGAWLSQLALAASRVDQPELTKTYAGRCLELLSKDQPSHQASIARALLALSHSEGLRGAYEEAIVFLRESLALRQQLGDEWDIAQCFMRLGSMYGQQAQYDVQLREAGKENLKLHLEQARAMTEQGFAISQRLGEEFLTARFQTALAVITQLEGHVEESEELHRSSLTFYEAVGSLDGRCMAMNGLGGAAHLRQDFRLAAAHFSEALALARQIGARQWEANALTNLAICSVDLGELRGARSYFQQSQAVFRALGHEQYVAMIQNEIDDLNAQIKAG